MRLTKCFLFVLIFLFGCYFANAQNSSSFQKSYKNGKDLFRLGKYALAMEAFKPLTREGRNNVFAEYASFHYALSAYKAGQHVLAKNMFLQLVNRYPNWERIDDAYYWLAKTYFDEKDYRQAFTYLDKIKGKAVKEDAAEMKNFYLGQIDDVAALQQLLQENPHDKAIAEALAQKIIAQPLAGNNRQLLDFLIDEFNLDKKKYGLFDFSDSRKKESYNVAVMFPFMYSDLSPGKNPRFNQFVLDTYEGIKLAKDKLEEEGIKINLFAYDTRKDSAVTAGILNLDELKNMDLIIGPLYPEASKLVSNFSARYKINMVNPLSTNSQVIGNNPLSFLYKPSLETQARNAAEYANKNFFNKDAMIFYGTSGKDSVLAYSYKNAIEKDSFKIVTMQRLHSGNSKKILDILAPPEEETEDGSTISMEEEKEEEEIIGHVFVASSNELIVANAISAIEIRGDKTPLIGNEDWLDLKFVSYEQLERLKVCLLAPNFMDYNKKPVLQFKEGFIKKTNALPTRFAYSGYDMMVFLGRMLNKYGTYFQTGFEQEGFREGEVFPGYNYAGGNDNQFVPIVKFEDSELVIVNR